MIISFRALLIISGFILLVLDFLMYSAKKMGESYGMLWIVVSVALILTGYIKKDWSAFTYIDSKLLIPLLTIIAILVLLMFLVTSSISVLTRQNQELAMQVSLLNQENETLVKRIIGKEEILEMSLLDLGKIKEEDEKNGK